MRILQVIPYFVPAYSYGGPVKVCFDISKELVRRDHQVTVVTTDVLDKNGRITKREETIDGIRVIRFKNISNQLAKNYNGYLPIGFYSWCRDNIQNFDIVHCHDFFTYQNIVIAHFCKKYDVPFIVQPHGTLSPVRQNARFRGAKQLFMNFFSDVLERSKNIIALTKNEKEEICLINNVLKDRVEIIPNGIKMEEFENIHKIDLHEKYSIPKENKIIGYVGRLQYIKGIDISLGILAHLKSKIDFTYLIIGPDEGEKEKLEKIIEKLGLVDNVIFSGILTGKEKLEVMKSCGIFLFTSRNEGLPITILEVAALGVPQIISKNCHVPEIEEYQGGFEIDLEDTVRYTESIVRILLDADTSKNMSLRAREIATKIFNFNDIIKKIEKLYI
jgi:glycosyltransferase involved in cell wall biosynthesis